MHTLRDRDDVTVSSREKARILKRRFCFVTEVDLDRQGAGAITTDQHLLSCLEEFGDVHVIYLSRIKYRSTSLALLIFFLKILRSFSKSYDVYFSRGLITSLFLVVLKRLTQSRAKIVQRGLSVPLASQEVQYLRYSRRESFVRFYLFNFLERFVLGRIDAITVAADEYARDLPRVGVGRNKVHVVPFYVEDEFFQQSIKKRVSELFTFCYVGGFHHYQDLTPVLEAFEQFSNGKEKVELLLVGDGPMRLFLEREVETKKLQDKIKFSGKFPHSSLPAFLSKMDCFISLTRKPGMSISILEATAAGKPVISLAKKEDATLARFFKHKEEIFFINSIIPQDIANAMEVLYTDEGLRNRLAIGGRRVAQEFFTKDVVLRHLRELINQMAVYRL